MAGELILIVEDNEKNRKLVRDLLQFHKYRTVEAITGEEGVEIARAQRPDLILMDIQLPGMDGFAAFRHLREDPATRGIPVIAVTASAMPQDRERILAAGFDGYQTKPISVKSLPDIVRDTLKGRSASKQPRPQSPPRDAS
ncbi:MAG: response regulator [Nitrospiraceae bacterium]